MARRQTGIGTAIKVFFVIVAFALVVGLLLLTINTGLAAFFYEQFFNRRIDSPFTNLTAQALERNPDIVQAKFDFASAEKNQLQGYFFSRRQADIPPKALVVFAHGFGPGYAPYLEQLFYLVRQNYLVYAFDMTGIGSSGGKSLIGFAHPPIDLRAALTALAADSRTDGLPVILYGHSWGAWAATAALYDQTPIAGVVALAGTDNAQDEIIYMGERLVGQWAPLLRPGLWVYEFIKFGSVAHRTALGGLSKASGTPALLIHAKDDEVAPFSFSQVGIWEKKGDSSPNQGVTAIALPEGGHNFYALSYSGGAKSDPKYGYLDPQIMDQIVAFLDRAAAEARD